MNPFYQLPIGFRLFDNADTTATPVRHRKDWCACGREKQARFPDCYACGMARQERMKAWSVEDVEMDDAC